MERNELIGNARDLAAKCWEKYPGCAEATFIAIADTLDLEGKKSVVESIVGLSGGIADFGTGPCGAIAGAVAAISLSFGVVPTRSEEDCALRDKIFDVIAEVVNRFNERYGGLSCRAVQMALFGKSFDLHNPERLNEYRAIRKKGINVSEDAAAWAVEAILRIQPEHLNPR